MNKKNKNNKLRNFLIFDLVMLLLFVLLFNRDIMPSKLHEVVGLVMLGMAAIHLILHPFYIVRVAKEAFSRNSRLTKKARFSYILNFLLLIILVLMIISSVLISREIFNNYGTFFMKNLHKTLAALMILIIGIHLGLHYKMIANKLKLNKVLSRILLSVFLAFGVISLATTSFPQYLMAVTASSEGHNLRQGNGQGKGLGKGLNRGEHDDGEHDDGEHDDASESVIEHGSLISELDFVGVGFTIISYASIVFVFCFATHIVEDSLKRKKKDKEINEV